MSRSWSLLSANLPIEQGQPCPSPDARLMQHASTFWDGVSTRKITMYASSGEFFVLYAVMCCML